jgi:hypothetical protein
MHTKNANTDDDDAGQNTGCDETHRPATHMLDLVTPTDLNKTGNETFIEGENGSDETGVAATAGIDASWFGVTKGGSVCVLCTVQSFRLRCTRSTADNETKETEAAKVRFVDSAPACRRCGLRYDWHTVDVDVCGLPDERLCDGELVRAARMVAHWGQMRSIGVSLPGFSLNQMVLACVWLGTSAQG